MQILFVRLLRRFVCLVVSPTQTILEIADIVCCGDGIAFEGIDIPPIEMRLHLQGLCLKLDRTLADYRISNGSPLYIRAPYRTNRDRGYILKDWDMLHGKRKYITPLSNDSSSFGPTGKDMKEWVMRHTGICLHHFYIEAPDGTQVEDDFEVPSESDQPKPRYVAFLRKFVVTIQPVKYHEDASLSLACTNVAGEEIACLHLDPGWQTLETVHNIQFSLSQITGHLHNAIILALTDGTVCHCGPIGAYVHQPDFDAARNPMKKARFSDGR